MELSWPDIAAFVIFVAVVLGISLYASRKGRSDKDYFLAGRQLTWWLIGFSLIASNISTEHFVGMAGDGYAETGLAIASYEWIAAITLVFVALLLLPLFLRLGIYTMPEFLEHRYGPGARVVMAVFMMVGYVGVAMAAVLYAGAQPLAVMFDIDLVTGIWIIGLVAGAYTVYGGLKAVVWSDLLQGAALLLGGALVLVLGLSKAGGLSVFLDQNADRLHMVLPSDHDFLPWTALCFGIFIPNFFYWGFNQFITQRTLGSRSLAHGQKGIVLAAFIKLLIPFIIVFPGIIAFQLYRDEIGGKDQAYAVLVKNILPPGLTGLFFAALLGAIMSSLDSMLNSASTIFTMDIYKRHIRRDATPEHLVKVGRIATVVFVLSACLLGPLPGKLGAGVFEFIQKFWGFFSPGIVAVFFFGLVFRRAPSIAAVSAMILGIPIYGALNWWIAPDIAFLNHMAITFGILVLVMAVLTVVKPLPEPVTFPRKADIDLGPSRLALWLGNLVIILTVVLYIIFW
jgi:SSS family solute:Na+ symporter